VSTSQNPVIFGRYQIVRRVGEGGMGEIYLARQVGLSGFDRWVILKSVLPQLAKDPGVIESFLDEARIVGAINHPNVVAIYEVGEWEGTYFMAMEYVDGVDLNEVAEAARAADAPPTPRFVASVGRDAALGLDAAHHAVDPNGNPLNVVHRDVTPHNIMVRRDGLVKLLDFGVAAAENKSQKTQQGVVKGKLGYFSPEQCTGDPMDGRSDQFVLGVVLWELLTGDRAFGGDNPMKVMHTIANVRLPPPSSRALLPPALDALVARMTALDPAERFSRCNEVADALRGFIATQPGDENEVASTVRRHCGAMLDERANARVEEPVALGVDAAGASPVLDAAQGLPSAPRLGGAAPLPVADIPAGVIPPPPPGAALPPAGAPAPAPAPAPMGVPLPSPAGLDLTASSAAPAPTAAAAPSERHAFREFELELDDDAPSLELATRENEARAAGDLSADGAAEGGDLLDYFEAEDERSEQEEEAEAEDLLIKPIEEELRDEITVVWCACQGLDSEGFGAASRDRLMAQLEASATHEGARFSVVGRDGVVCIFGAEKIDNQWPRTAVRLATELVGVVDEVSADVEAVSARAGVATGKAPQRDANGVATPTVKDEAVDRARRLALNANPSRIMVAQTTQMLTGRRVRFEQDLRTLNDHWNVPFAASEVAGFGSPPTGAQVFGREAETAGVTYVVDAASRRRAGGVVLVGEPGVGKTTLLGEAERVARWKGMVVARAECSRVTASIPFDAARQLVRTAAAEVTERLGGDDDALSGKSAVYRAAALLDFARADRRRVETFLGERPAERGVPIDKRRALIRTAVFAFFRAIADQVGICLLCDDVDRMDEQSLELIGTALERMPDTRVACLGTSSGRPADGLFTRLPPVKLSPLDRRAASRLAHAAALDMPMPPAVHQLVFERAAGNPLATELIVRMMISSGALEREGGGWEARPTLKRFARQHGAVRELVWGLAATLSPAARTLLRLLAHIGTTVPQELLAGVIGDGTELASALNELTRVELVKMSPTGASIRFATASTRDAAWALPVERGAPGNPSTVVALALAKANLNDRPLHHELLALHGRVGSAADAMVAGSAASGAYHAGCGHADLAEDAYRRAMSGMYKAATRGARNPKTYARLMRLIAAAAEWQSLKDPQAAVDLPVPLLRDLPVELAPVQRAQVQRERARLLIGLGRLSDAERALADALALAPTDVEPEAAAATLGVHALAFEARKDLQGAIDKVSEALALLETRQCEDKNLKWTTWMSLGRLLALWPDSARAMAGLSRAFQEASAVRSVRGVAQITELTARVWYEARDIGAAVSSYDLAADHWLTWGDRVGAAQSLHASALILAKELRFDDAAARAARAQKLAREAEWSAGVEAIKKVQTVIDARR
jgi:tetratricopeptide (TPR) repeat protein